MILIIDNYDSFTYNLFQQVSNLGYDVLVKKHDEVTVDEINVLRPSHIIVSPGPKTPKDSGVSLEVIKKFYKSTPILGVCLGHQCIGEVFGSQTIAAKSIVHGKADNVFHNQQGLFKGIDTPFKAARYHSLVVSDIPEGFAETAWSEDGTIMAMQHITYPLFGVQFHPESFMTEYGENLMRNFLDGKY